MFFKNNFKMIITLILMAVSLFGTWYLYEDNQTLTTDLANKKVEAELCKADYLTLKDELGVLQIDVDEMKTKNETLENKVGASKQVIKKINNDRELLLQRLDAQIPEDCNDIFQWMLQKTEELKLELNDE